jgi:hypothetical protein
MVGPLSIVNLVYVTVQCSRAKTAFQKKKVHVCEMQNWEIKVVYKIRQSGLDVKNPETLLVAQGTGCLHRQTKKREKGKQGR